MTQNPYLYMDQGGIPDKPALLLFLPLPDAHRLHAVHMLHMHLVAEV